VRLIVPALVRSLGQPVVVDNRGANAVVPVVLKASPDGYTLLFYGSTFWISTLLEKASYDPVRDFSPVALVTRSYNLITVHPSIAAHSVKELIALAKAKPGALNYGSGATGASTHLAAELFKALAGVNIVRIPYKGAGPAINSLLAGEVQVMFPSASSISAHVKSGKVRALAVTSAQPTPLVPGLPTVAASGVPGFESSTVNAVFAPAKTPAKIISRLNAEIVRGFNQPEVKETLLSIGIETVGSSPQELATIMNSEMARLGKVIKEAGLRQE
jgi:tripartite-type tricarboxylate transporter receptor subunit TctC